MTNQPEVLVEGWRLFHLGQLPAAIHLAQNATSSEDLAPLAQLLLVRCLLEQGRFRQAETICNKVLATLPSNSELAWEMRLWCACLQIYLTGNLTLILEEARTVLAENKSPKSRAMAQDLLGRGKAITVVWNLSPPSDLVEAKHLLGEAVDNYYRSGDSDTALAALLKLGRLHLLSTPDPATAQSIFQQARDQAQTAGNQVRQAEAALRLAELDFDTMLTQRAANPEVQLDPTLYHQAITLYESVNHVLGSAEVLLSLGSRTIKAGYDGSDAVQQAMQIYRQEDNLTGLFNSLIDLSTWYLQQGEVSQSLDCRQQAATIAQEMNFPLAQATAYLGIGDYYFRTGDYARAKAACEQVEQLTAVPSVLAMQGLNLANIYTLMNLPDRAKKVCCSAIKTFKQAGSSKSLSLAYFILGNVLSSSSDWVKAILVWRKGLEVDEACQYRFEQAEKLKCIAQATVMQHHCAGSSLIPDPAYFAAMALYSQAIDLLKTIGNNEAVAGIAGTYQLQGQTAVACKRSLDAVSYLEKARNTYADLGLATQTAITDTLLGLVCHDLGNRGYPHLHIEAARFCSQALSYFQNAKMRDITWKIRFYLADIEFMQSFQGLVNEEQQVHWQNAAHWLEEAAADIELVRGGFIESNAVATETARLGLISDKEKVYKFAIKLHYWYLKLSSVTFNWLERLKGRAFLDSLALTPLRPPSITDKKLLERERELLVAINRASTQVEVVELSDRLHTLWEQMVTSDPAASEYVSLRRGLPLKFEDVKACLLTAQSHQA
ncbi:tetratricopeptide repeat protein [Nostoc sp. ChiVER01]|uniref:tetratricopeptide repeat protein n=1 Tax=Nostoc sp. ChiVER01 TaxID=3075382 RepID=UPI002AD25B2D|nr:tetratricopeptide repeat protein [Nostoc sp. ChiVER01]MDZ8226733.1 tetratricopeptide repeat protein [Nostoc sp. ChiVER01]